MDLRQTKLPQETVESGVKLLKNKGVALALPPFAGRQRRSPLEAPVA